LNMLDLSNNHFTCLNSDIFIASPTLNHLDLSHNWLKTLNLSIMPQLTKVLNDRDLHDNQWLCDCSKLYPVYSWCRDNGVNFRLKCSDPPRFKGKIWTVFDKKVCENSGESLEQVKRRWLAANYHKGEIVQITKSNSHWSIHPHKFQNIRKLKVFILLFLVSFWWY
jgi:hypothetical protein